jgi:hydroxylamine reductase
MTTNCIQKPRTATRPHLHRGLVAWPGVRTSPANGNFTPVIEAALAAPGLRRGRAGEDDPRRLRPQRRAGRGRQGGRRGQGGQDRHFFLIGGCDGAKRGRNYYTDFAKAVPKDCVILTLACGKYRFNKLEFGTLGGMPRLLDCGQCNDAYSAIKIAGGAGRGVSAAASTTCRCRWSCRGTSRRPSASC